MKKLKDLLHIPETLNVTGNTNINIKCIRFDSRKVENGDLFIARKGSVVDGHQFIEEAITKGARAIVCEKLPSVLPQNITFVLVKNAARTLASMSNKYFDYPSSKLQLVGITGTNGKTTVATLLYQVFRKLGYKAGLLSTIKNYVDEEIIETTHTTLDSFEVNKLLDRMIKRGCDYCFMEVSSHAIDQNRTDELQFKGGIFTNITHEHLDYHKTFSAYLQTKKVFFDRLNEHAFVLTNIDDKNGKVMLQNTKANKFSYSIAALADFRCRVLERHFNGMLINLDGMEMWTRLIGDFNACNLLAVYGASQLLDQPKEKVMSIMSELTPVAGRFETIQSTNGVMAIVDYAHTPDALKNVLQTIGQLRTHNGKVITVVGAGGDRDKTKRPQMAYVCAKFSDRVILTSDNPRMEDPDAIIRDMKEGIEADELKKTVAITDRKEAIRMACIIAQKGDIILVAGKGHEDYQEIKGVKYHFDDREVIKENLNL